MQRETVTLVNKLGLHARAAASFVRTASAYDCEVGLALNGKSVNGKSIMGVMSLGAARGSTLELSADGPGEAEAVAALARLIAERFGEES